MSTSRSSINDHEHKLKSLNYEDIPRIFASLAIYGAAFGYGACLGVLGPSLTDMSQELGIDVSTIGQVFSWRGVGGLAGTFFAAWLAELPDLSLSKHFIVVLAIIFSDIAMFLVPFISILGTTLAFNTIKILYFLQGMGFGTIDTMAVISIQEMWGQRAQPWMQMKSLSCSLGAVVGPVCVSNFGYSLAFKYSALVGLSSLIGVMLESLLLLYDKKEKFGDDFVAPELENLVSNLEAIHEELESETHSILGSIDMGSVMSGSDFQDYNKVLSFATPKIVELLDEPVAKIVDVHIVPHHVSMIIAGYTLFLSGLYYSYGGWISPYTIMIDPAISVSEAAKMASLYSSCMVISGLWGIASSLFLSTSSVLRIQLFILFLGAVVLYVPMDIKISSSISSILIGLAVSCMYPLLVTLANDYEMTMDTKGVSMVILGGGAGEALAPAAIGVLIGEFGANVFPLSVASTAVVMLGAYVYVHCSLLRYQKQLLHPMVTEERVRLLSESGEEETRPRSRSRITRGWRSLSVEKYSGSEALEMIIESDNLPSLPENEIFTTGSSHLSYQNDNF